MSLKFLVFKDMDRDARIATLALGKENIERLAAVYGEPVDTICRHNIKDLPRRWRGKDLVYCTEDTAGSLVLISVSNNNVEEIFDFKIVCRDYKTCFRIAMEAWAAIDGDGESPHE